MKARDIITGWPRGKSTMSRGWEIPDEFSNVWGRMNWRPSDVINLLGELRANQRYHRGQQAMVDEYFSRYRNSPPRRGRAKPEQAGSRH